MPAVVRIKRRIDEEPLSAFILNSKKRRRLDNVEGGVPAEGAAAAAAAIDVGAGGDGAIAADKDDEISTILKFAGTIQEQDNSATTQLARLTKEAAKELVQQKSIRQPTNHTERARQEMRQALHENRFRVVNCMRTTLDDTDAAEAVKEVTIVDIEKQEVSEQATSTSTTNETNLTTAQSLGPQQQQHSTTDTTYEEAQFQQQQQQMTDSDTGYVYDLYLPENEWQMDSSDMMDDNYLSVRPYDDLVYEDRFNDYDEEEDSDDSNNENYFTNDYPDEDDDNEDYLDSYDHGDIEAMAMGIRHMRVGTHEGYIHTFDADGSSVSEYEDSSDDDGDFVYGRSIERGHIGRGDDDADDDDDDDVDYYDAGGNSDDSEA